MYDILVKPLVTEKNTLHASRYNEYTFEVQMSANRGEIKKAVESLFKVTVLRVNTMVCRKNARRLGKVLGKRRLWKKAVVKLKEGDKFDFVAT